MVVQKAKSYTQLCSLKCSTAPAYNFRHCSTSHDGGSRRYASAACHKHIAVTDAPIACWTSAGFTRSSCTHVAASLLVLAALLLVTCPGHQLLFFSVLQSHADKSRTCRNLRTATAPCSVGPAVPRGRRDVFQWHFLLTCNFGTGVGSFSAQAQAWGARYKDRDQYVQDTMAQVLSHAPGHPRTVANLPDEEQVLVQIWLGATGYAPDSDLLRAGGRQVWAAALLEELQTLRKKRRYDKQLLHPATKHTAANVDLFASTDNRITPPRLVDAADRMLEKFGDPYAQYYPPEEWGEVEAVAAGSDVAGFGVAFAQDTSRGKGGSPAVVAVVPGSMAALLGVQIGDRLLLVDGKPVLRPADAARLIPGMPGTRAIVQLQSGPSYSPRNYTLELERAIFKIDPVEAAVLFVSDSSREARLNSTEAKLLPAENDYRIAFLKIRTFNGPNVQLPLQQALTAFNSKPYQVSRFMVDLRGNLGGRVREAHQAYEQLQQAAETAAASAATSATASGDSSALYAPSKAPPITVLVDSNTASASELLAWEMRRNPDFFNGTLVVSCGDPPAMRTFGKSEEQEAVDLSDGGALLITTSRWAPQGFRGITADVLCDASGVPRWIHQVDTKKLTSNITKVTLLSQGTAVVSQEFYNDPCIRCAATALGTLTNLS